MNRVWKGLVWGALFLAVMAIAFYCFSTAVDQLTAQSINGRLAETSENNAKAVELMFSRDIETLTRMAGFWESGEALTSEASLAYLSEIAANTGYLRMGLDLPDGTSYTSDGHRVDVTDMGYLDKVLAGKPILTGFLATKVEGAPCFAVAVPIFRGGKVVGALRGVYRGDILMEITQLHTFENKGYFCLVSADGDFLVNFSKDRLADQGDSIFAMLAGAEFQEDFSLERVRQDLSRGASAYTLYTLDGVEQCAYYTPVGISQWYILSMVPTQHLIRQKRAIDLAALLLLLTLAVLFSLLMAYIVWQNRVSRRRLRRDHDYLERVLNNIPLPVFIVNADYHLNFVNQAANRLFGKDKEVLGRPCSCFGTSICGTPECAIAKMEREGICHTYYSMDGKRFMVSTAVLAQGEERDGKFIEVIQDITEVVETQRILEEKTQELETMTANLAGGILITTLGEGFPVLQCNQRYLDLVGGADGQIVGRPAIGWVAPADAGQTEQLIRRQLQNNEDVSFEHRLLRGDGTEVWVSLRGRQAVLHGEQVGVWMLTDISGIREAELELKISEERYRTALRNTEDIIIDYNTQTRVMYHSPGAAEVYGLPELVESVPESLLESGVVLEESAVAFREMFLQIHGGAQKCACEIRMRAVSGNVLWNRLSFTTVFDAGRVPVRAVGLLQDITREKEAELQSKREARYRELSGKEGTFYYEVDLTHHRFLSGHEALMQEALGRPEDEFDLVLEQLLAQMVFEPDRELVRSHIGWEALIHSFEAGITHTTFEYRRSVDSKAAWVECALHTFQDEESGALHCVGCIKDINDAKMRELTFQKKAERDLLTGLYNKVTAEMRIRQLVEHGDGRPGAFLLIDLDDFKRINDTLGHAVGTLC